MEQVQGNLRPDGGLARWFRTAIMFRLAPGITGGQLLILVGMFIAARCTSELINLMQPFVLNEQLGVPRAEQGQLTGAIGSAQQIMLLATIGFAGTLSDRYGRRRMMMAALGLMALCSFAFPFVTTIAALVLVRMLNGLATTAYTAGGVPLIHDFPAEDSRGRFVSFIIVVNLVGSAIFVGFVGARLPGWLIQGGLTPASAGQAAFAIYGVVALLGLLLTWRAFKEPPVVQRSTKQASANTWQQLRAVFAHGRTNPRFKMLILLSFVTRADTAVLQSFLTLWIVNAGAAKGLPTSTSMVTAGTLLVILNVASFLMPPFFGALADRWDKIPMLLFSLFVGGIAFMAPLIVTDPFEWPVIVVILLIGVAEGAQTVSSQAMFGEETPAHLRGSAFGLFTIFGTISVVVVTALGGLFFDKLGYGAPFALVGVLNFIFLGVVYICVRRLSSDGSEIATPQT